MELAYKSIQELTELVNNGTLSSIQIWEYFNKRAQELNPELNAFNSFNEQ